MLATADHFGDWATAVGAAATIGLLGAAIWAGRTAKASVTTAATGIKQQIQHQQEIERRRRVYEHLRGFYSQDFTEASVALQDLLESFKPDPNRGRAAWEEMDKHDRVRVVRVLNFYELVATEYNAQFLDRGVANRHLAYIVVTMWEVARDLIALLRSENPAYFQDWKHLYEHHGEHIIAVAQREPAS